MANILSQALDSKIGRAVRGVSVVDNAANPDSAYSKAQAAFRTGKPRMNPQNAAMEKRMNAATKKTRTFGTPLVK